MRRRILVTVTVVVLTAFIVGGPVPHASAHEGRRVGAFQLTVGWGTEPAYAGFQNSVSVEILEAAEPHRPVNDLRDTLKVEVSFGSQKQTYTLEPKFVVGVFGDPGHYGADLVPSRPGTYSFLFTGAIRGQRINARFTSSDTTFDNVHNTTDAQFPVKDPSTGDLAARIDREIPRVEASLAAALRNANDETDKAKMFGYGGLGLGVIAIIIALARGRRKAA